MRALFVMLMWAASPAAAQTPPDQLEARALFDAGRSAADDGRHEDALRLFERSLALHPTAAAAFNAALSARRAGEAPTALTHVDALLAGTHGPLPDARRAEVETLRRELLDEVGVLTVQVEPPETRILIDGREVDPARFYLMPPRNTVTIVFPDGAQQERDIDVRSGERQVLQIVQPRAGEPGATGDTRPGSDDTPLIVGLVIGAALAVGIGVAIGVGVHEESQLPGGYLGQVETLAIRF